jgi:transposase
MLLLPEAVDDYVGADNPVRFIDAFVDELDLAAAGFVRVEAKATGRPGYAPADLLKLYIYGYLNRVRSSRRLEMESHRNIEVIWLLRSLKPDFKTIADFRRDNRAAFRSVFREFVLLCRRLDLYGRELLAVDGTRIKAVNNKDRNFTRTSLQEFIRAADERLDDYLRRLDEGDVAEGGTGGGAGAKNLAEKIAALRQKRGRYGSLLAELERTGESQISLTDPDSRAMAAHTKVGVGYNAQVAVDAKHKMIVEQAVTNQVVDISLLMQTAEPARVILDVERIDVVADRGYFKIEDIEACEKAGLTCGTRHVKMRLGVHHLRTRRPPRAARNKGLLFWKSSTSIMRSRFPSLAPPSLAFRRAISRPFRLPISRLPIPRRRRSKIPAMRHFRPLPILTRSKPANQIPRIRRCARAA